MNKNIHNNLRQGFTLIELLVAMGLFAAVSGIVSAMFVRSMVAQRTVVGLMAANDGASLSLEQMAREMRTGTDFIEVKNDEEISFTSADGKSIRYILSDGAIQRLEDVKQGKITPDTINIRKFGINIAGSASGDRKVTLITISLEVGYPKKDQRYTTFQMTISPRTITDES